MEKQIIISQISAKFTKDFDTFAKMVHSLFYSGTLCRNQSWKHRAKDINCSKYFLSDIQTEENNQILILMHSKML